MRIHFQAFHIRARKRRWRFCGTCLYKSARTVASNSGAWIRRGRLGL